MKKVLRKLLVSTAVLLLLVSAVAPTALALTDKVWSLQKIEGYDYNFSGLGLPEPFGNATGSAFIKYIGEQQNQAGETIPLYVSYCIDFTKHLSGGAEFTSQNLDDLNFSEAKKNLIAAAVSNGYNVYNELSYAGGTETFQSVGAAYHVTQVMVWIIAGNSADGTYFDTADETRIVQAFFANHPEDIDDYNKLKDAVKAAVDPALPAGFYRTETEADASARVMPYDVPSGKYKAVITDTVLAGYTLDQTSVPSGVTVEVNGTGDTWTVYATQPAEFTLRATKAVALGTITVWNQSDGSTTAQRLVTYTRSDQHMTVPAYITLQSNAGSVEVRKTSEDGQNLGGITFKLDGSPSLPVLTAVTDATGHATFTNVPVGSYVLSEDSGYGAQYVQAPSQNITVTANQTTTANFENKLVRGRIAFTKHREVYGSSTFEPFPGVTFEIYNASGTKVSEVVTDANGRAVSAALPYGTYTVKEVLPANSPYATIPDFTVEIEINDVTVEMGVFQDRLVEGRIRIEKVDAESGDPIAYAGAEFKIKALANNTYVVQNGTDVFKTASDGSLILAEPLKGGDYQLEEVKAPDGYLLNTTPVSFSVNRGNITTVQVVRMTDQAVKGTINVLKTGEVLSTFTTADNQHGTLYTPVYAQQPLAGIRFEIRAEEDIVTGDGTVHYRAGDLVETITTGADGTAKSGQLYLGRYAVYELNAPAGFTQPSDPMHAVLTYAGQTTSLVSVQLQWQNIRQRADVSFTKDMETATGSATKPFTMVVYGLYAAESLTAADGTAVPADGLLQVVYLDDTGKSVITVDLPIGKYYIKELQTAEGYLLDTAKHAFELTAGTGASLALEGLTGTLVNRISRGSGKIVKVDPSGNSLPGATFKVYTANDVFIGEITTGSDGTAVIGNLTYGRYYIVETKAPAGMALDSTKHYFSIQLDGQTAELRVVNNYPPIPPTDDGTHLGMWLAILGTSTVAWVSATYVLMRKKRMRETQWDD